MQIGRHRTFRTVVLAAWFITSAAGERPTSAQGPGPARLPANPGEAVTSSPEPTTKELLEEVRKMRKQLNWISQEYKDLSEKYESLSSRVEAHPVSGTGGGEKYESQRTDDGTKQTITAGEPPGGFGGAGSGEGTSGGGSASGGGDPTNTGKAQVVGNRHVGRLRLEDFYDFDNDGFTFRTPDHELSLQVRAMTQLDARIYQQRDQDPVSSGFYNPRTRIYFQGNLTRPIQYEVSFQNTFDTVGLLDAYLNINYDPRFQFRVGRYKTPFTYEWYRVHVWHLLAPERSLFATNFESNRRFGLMGWGSLFDQRLEYAVGAFDGQRNSYSAFANSLDILAFMNFKPFETWEGSVLQNLQLGGSVDAGSENQPLIPSVLYTSSPPTMNNVNSTTASNVANVPFLAFNDNVRERGSRQLWELHTAYYRGGLSLMAAWESGFQHYATTRSGTGTTKVPIDGYFVQVGYLITGETIRDRTLIDPLRPFDLRPGHFGLGAFEPTARFSALTLGDQVFAAGLADRNRWTNRAQMIDVGFNWYLNKFVKIYFDWEHAVFGQPVEYRPGARQLTSDLFWLRFQVYF